MIDWVWMGYNSILHVTCQKSLTRQAFQWLAHERTSKQSLLPMNLNDRQSLSLTHTSASTLAQAIPSTNTSFQ
uniref:Uncharacterized protein n=1 Tax=Picea glauca TaxID=3330 RepID=A0A101M2V2_PICGL|nr:hypothetical protein ABT39_MTgene3111 [Picea glauca]QHR86473.1 hypothetical protein Q903MT_gene473 [Picea sitchensis]